MIQRLGLAENSYPAPIGILAETSRFRHGLRQHLSRMQSERARLVDFANHIKDLARRIAYSDRDVWLVYIARVPSPQVVLELIGRHPGGLDPPYKRHGNGSIGCDIHLSTQLRLSPHNYFQLVITPNYVRRRLYVRMLDDLPLHRRIEHLARRNPDR